LVKLYTPEADSPYFMELAARSGEPIVSSAITAAEIVSAAWRKELAGALQPGGARVATQHYLNDCGAGRIVAIPYGEDVLTAVLDVVRLAYSAPEAVPIRAADAIHLASARVAGARVVVATDARLRALAGLMQFEVLPPLAFGGSVQV
jgi:predicted nucleic acid-binding protein